MSKSFSPGNLKDGIVLHRRWLRTIPANPVYFKSAVYGISRQEKIEKDRLLQKAQNDGLTGIYNSATIRENITKALNQSSFGGALLIMDIDHFKSINDRYGHSVGDHVLTQVGMK